MNTPTIEISNLTKLYTAGLPWRKAVLALQKVFLEFRGRTCVGILGPNGTGKSTLLKIVLGLVRPTGGTVKVCGVPAGDPGALQRTGYMPERFSLPAYFTPLRTLRIAAGFSHASTAAEIRQETGRLLGISGLQHESRRMVTQLSRGMQQRLCFAQAMAGTPDVLVLDEPFNGVDIEGQREFKKILLRARDNGAIVLLSTHNHADVEELCDEVIVIVQGTVLARLEMQAIRRFNRFVITVGDRGAANLGPPEFPGAAWGKEGTDIEVEGSQALDAALRELGRLSVPVLSVRSSGGALEREYLSLCRQRSGS